MEPTTHAFCDERGRERRREVGRGRGAEQQQRRRGEAGGGGEHSLEGSHLVVDGDAQGLEDAAQRAALLLRRPRPHRAAHEVHELRRRFHGPRLGDAPRDLRRARLLTVLP